MKILSGLRAAAFVLCFSLFMSSCSFLKTTTVSETSSSETTEEETIKKRDASESFGEANYGVYLKKDLTVLDVVFTSFSEDRYDVDEYRTYLEEELEAYNNEHGEGSISIEKCEVNKDELEQRLLYATAKDYTTYNKSVISKRGGTTLQAGLLSQADSTVLKSQYVDPDGDDVDVAALSMDAEGASYRYFICNFEATMYGEGEVVAVSVGTEYNDEHDSVPVSEGQTTIVIYRND